MKKILVILSFGLFLSLSSSGQYYTGEYQDLFDMYILEEYDDCIKKAEKYHDKDKTRRDPEPYLYSSLCYYQIHKNPDASEEEEYKKDPLKDAVLDAYKFMRKDDDGKGYENNKEFFENLKESVYEHSRKMHEEENFRKSYYYLKYINKYDTDPAVQFMLGVYQYTARNEGQGERNMEMAIDTLKGRYIKPGKEVPEETQKRFEEGYIIYSDYLMSKNNKGRAVSVLKDAMEFFPNSDAIREQYEKLSS